MLYILPTIICIKYIVVWNFQNSLKIDAQLRTIVLLIETLYLLRPWMEQS